VLDAGDAAEIGDDVDAGGDAGVANRPVHAARRRKHEANAARRADAVTRRV